MLELKEELFSICSALDDAGVPYAICGGIAVIIHGYPRGTKDIDFMVRREDLDRAQTTVEALGYDLVAGLIPFDVGTDREREVFRITKAVGRESLTLDLVITPSFFEDVWESRERRAIDSHEVTVVSAQGLLKMKRLAGRPQDLADISLLENDYDGKSP